MKKYACQMRFKDIGLAGQKKLKKSCIAIVGVGALGTLATDYLSRAGVGELILIDKDKIEEVNLHRQLLYSHKDIGKNKVDIAKRELLKGNPEVNVEIFKEFLTESNAKKILKEADLILDCTDKMSSRKIINDYCRKTKKIWIHAAVSGSRCNVFVVDNPALFSKHFRTGESFDECNEFAVIGPVAGVAACISSVEAIKILTGNMHCKDLQRFDLWKNKYELLKIK
jgi:molybdopterin/thiamine biosynthesis adenylyltransferase